MGFLCSMHSNFVRVILISFLNVWYPILCVEIPIKINGEFLELMLQQAIQLKGDHFAIWNLESETPVLVGVNQIQIDYISERHIIVQRTRESQEEWNLCYWIPKYSPRRFIYELEQSDMVAAAYTMALDQVLNENSSYHYSRECYGFNYGPQFVDMFDACLAEGVFKKFSLKTRKRGFVILEKQNAIIIRQGSPMKSYLYKNNCAVLYSGNVYIFCGDEFISNRLRNATYTLGNLVKEEVQKYYPDVGYIEVEYGKSVEKLSTQEIQNAMEFYHCAGYPIESPFEVPEIMPHITFDISILRTIWRGQRVITLSKDTDDQHWFTSAEPGPLLRSMLKTNECHIVLYREEHHDDIFFLWIGAKSTIEDRIRAAIKAEQTVSTFYNTDWDGITSDRLTGAVVVEGKEPLEFKTIFVDWIDEENRSIVMGLKHLWKLNQ